MFAARKTNVAYSAPEEHDCGCCELARCPLKPHITAARDETGVSPQRLISLARGTRLVGGLNPCRRLWVVVSGLVGLSTTLADGRRQITSLNTSGDILCPVGGAEGVESWVDILAPSQLCEIDLAAMISTGLAPALSASLFRATHVQLERSNANLIMLGRFDGLERVALFLAEMTYRLGDPCPGGYRVTLPLSREDIADYLGLNAETVSRLFTRIRKSRLVTFLSPTDFVVHDLDGLAGRAPTAAGLRPAAEAARHNGGGDDHPASDPSAGPSARGRFFNGAPFERQSQS
ncbi:MAG: hypothetical protein C0606_05245 [Hyphomicrobiales bacterium]|nr:MAG: hypothetical protein C0606_05245 [Hyphomicrobiales bacterium]